MIKNLKIEGFQSWLGLDVELSPKINIFVGESDSGKSAIIRALRWCLTNRPGGDYFKNNTLRKKDVAGVHVTFAPSGITLSRERSSTKNRYLITNGDDVTELKALRSDLPEEVLDVTRMKSTNIQPQHEQYFLLDQSPGAISKALNKVANLDIMDNALTAVNQQIRENTAKLERENARHTKIEEELFSSIWVFRAQKKINKINKNQAQVDLLESKRKQIKRTIFTINEKNQEAERVKPARTALKQLPKILNELQTIQSTQVNIVKPLILTVKSLSRTQKQLEQVHWNDSAHSALKSLISAAKAAPEKVWEKDRLLNLINKIKSNSDNVASSQNYRKKCREVFDHHLAKCKTCPLCGGNTA